MAISTPYYVSASAVPNEYVTLRVGSEVYVIVNKSHQGLGFPRRELEFFPLSQITTATSPPAYPVYPLRIELLRQAFSLISAIWLSGNNIRLYFVETWSPVDSALYSVDVDLVSMGATSPILTSTFTGTDPWIMDGRTIWNPNRLVLLYVKADGSHLGRYSDDLGLTWSAPATIDAAGSDVRQGEGNFDDPLVLKENISVLQQRDP